MRVCIPYESISTKDFDYILSNFQVDMVYVFCKEGEQLPATNVLGNSIRIESYNDLPVDIDKVLLQPQGGKYMQGNISLVNYVHRKDCIYIVGYNNTNLQESFFNILPIDLVYIPNDTTDEMFNYTTLAVVLYDRLVKNG